ncbi:MAG: PKD domain-containing protein [Euryarchaeota archaeon]|nr:PKD domain-containing protein [Euryarchaeota archaeon]MDE1837690.1 PKD domain-containing protein [Euryarchaeota archaeon]MDE1881792.1 PKD domain-containing protein [Euryarchaeota archaeon]MDE2045980.1 PKD domain-containing protein [Thermoplasmata archaeon]
MPHTARITTVVVSVSVVVLMLDICGGTGSIVERNPSQNTVGLPNSRADHTTGSGVMKYEGQALSADWTDLTSLSANPAPTQGLFAYDVTDSYDVQVGNWNGGTASTYVYSGLNWTNVTSTAGTPPPGELWGGPQILVYDAADGYLLLYMGIVETPSKIVPFPQTWSFHAGRWTNLTSTLGEEPSPRWGGQMVYDTHDGYVLLFGGSKAGYGGTQGDGINDTWVYGAGTWTNLTSSAGQAPSQYGASGATMGYDPLLGGVVAQVPAGGNSVDYWNQTWEFASGHWRELNRYSSYGQTIGGALGFDPQLGMFLMFGGINALGPVSTLWSYVNQNWTVVATAHSPPPTEGATLAWDSSQKLMFLWGGAWYEGTGFCGSCIWALALPLQVQGAVSSSSGPSPLEVAFSAIASGGVLPSHWSWHFGDGGSSTGENTTHAYLEPGTFVAWVNVTDRLSTLAQSATLTITVLVAFVPSFLASPTSGPSPLQVSFQAYGHGGTQPYQASWWFGDGTGASVGNTSHVYSAAGSYVATAWINFSSGATYSSRFSIVATQPPPPLVVDASANLTSGTSPLSVALNATATGGVPPLQFAWRFGDGGSSSVRNPSHRFATAGTYVVRLWVNESWGAGATSSLTVTVRPPPPASAPPYLVLDETLTVVLVAEVAALLLLRRRDRRQKERPAAVREVGDHSSRPKSLPPEGGHSEADLSDRSEEERGCLTGSDPMRKSTR